MESILRVFTSCLLVDVKFEEAVPELIQVVEVVHIELRRFMVWSKCSNIGLEDFQILLEVLCCDWLPDFYWMSKDGVYPSSIHFLSFRWMSI